MPTLDAFEHVVDPVLRLLLTHWLELRRGRLMPGRRDIDATRMVPVLPYVWLCDYDRSRDELRYRLAGEELNTVYGFSLKGREMSSIFPEATRARALQRTLQVVHERLILHSVGTVTTTTGRRGHGERLILPLADAGGEVKGLIGATIFALRDRRPRDRLVQDVRLTLTPVTGEPGPEPHTTTVALPWESPERA